ncbi:MAG: YHYH domain-containing protein [Myxococcales bacterium]
MKRLLLGVLLLVSPALVVAHPGGMDKDGGHVDKKTGKYHVHKKKGGDAADEGAAGAKRSRRAQADEDEAEEDAPKKKRSRRAAADEDEAEEDAPKKKKKRSRRASADESDEGEAPRRKRSSRSSRADADEAGEESPRKKRKKKGGQKRAISDADLEDVDLTE